MRETLQAGYIPLAPEPGRDRRAAVGGRAAGAAALRRAATYPAMAIEQSLPDAVGAFIDWLVHESGWTVTTRQAPRTPVPVQAGHVCILFRRFVSFGTDVTRAYVDALEARGVRHLLVGRPRLPRSRGDRDAARRAGRDRVARRRAVGVRHAARRAVRDRRRRAARVPASLSRARSTRSRCPRSCPRTCNRSAIRCAPLARLHDAAQPPAGGRNGDRACWTPRAPTWASRCGAAASRCWPTCSTSRNWPASTSATTACRSGASSSAARGGRARRRHRGADRRGRQRRRAPDDGAQGQGAGVPGRGAGRHHREAGAARGEPIDRRRRTGAARCGSAGGRPGICSTSRPTSRRATWPKACGSPTWPPRAPATCWWCRRWATSRTRADG